jgi:hypothetical protein
LFPAKTLNQGDVLDRFCDDGFPRRALAGTKDLQIADDAFGVRQCRQTREAPRLLDVGLAACRQGFRHRRPFRRRDQRAAKILGFDFCCVVGWIDAERCRQIGERRVAVARDHDRAALGNCFAHDVAEGQIGRRDHRVGERTAELAVRRVGAFEQHVERQLLEQLGLLGVVEHGKARGDIGLERELMQELGAESVDGLHLQPARGVERAREQAPRQRPPRSVGLKARSFANGLVQPGIVEGGPFGERVEHALGHVGGGGLGEGDAEDFFRLDAVEQKIDHALDQHVGLAGACIGGDPCRDGRIGDGALQLADGIGNDAGRSHSPPPESSAAPPVLDHSLTRARWS